MERDPAGQGAVLGAAPGPTTRTPGPDQEGALTNLFHFTCHHGHRALRADPHLLSVAAQGVDITPVAHRLRPMLRLVWLTDLAEPDRIGLGLTMHTITCDRTQYRWRATDLSSVVPWRRWSRGHMSRYLINRLEGVPGAKPKHWWVSLGPVPVEEDVW